MSQLSSINRNMDKLRRCFIIVVVGSFLIFLINFHLSLSVTVKLSRSNKVAPVGHDSCEIPERNYSHGYWEFYGQSIISVDQLNVIFCPILKNMHTRMSALFGRYIMRKPFDLVTQEDRMKVYSLFCTEASNDSGIMGVNMGLPVGQLQHKFRPQRNAVKFALIRDPIERFISAYLYICRVDKLCASKQLFDCGEDIFCILGNISNSLREKTFQSKNRVLIHFAPQHHYCYFRQCKSAYRLFHYSDSEGVGQSLTDFLIKLGFPPETLDTGWGKYKNSSWLAEPDIHNTASRYSNDRRNLLSNMQLVNEIYRVYKDDYDFFDLKVPKVYRSKCGKSQFQHLDICQIDA